MDLQHLLQQYLPTSSSQSTAEMDAEIREELECHLAMRTDDNLRAGMSPEQARLDARERFGDFEANRAACRKITLGPRLVVARLHTALFALLVAIVIYQGVRLVQLQSSSRGQVDSLRHLITELQESARYQAPSAAIPYLKFDSELSVGATESSQSSMAPDLAGWAIDNPIQEPWCDWRQLDEKRHDVPTSFP